MTPVDGKARVLFVIASTNRRGAEIECTDVAQRLAHTFAVDVVAVVPGTDAVPLAVRTLGRSVRSIATLRALRRAARAADLVIAYGSSSMPVCAIGLFGTGIPFVYRSIGDPGHWARGRVHRARTALMLRRAAHVVALWPGAADRFRELYHMTDSRLSCIPNGRDPATYHPPSPAERASARAGWGLDVARHVVAIVGALSNEKRVDIALRALAEAGDFDVLVAGDGPNRSSLQALGDGLLPGRVRWLGAVTDVVPILHAADALLLTSATEGMAGVLIEAGLCGLPVVASDVGAARSIVDDRVTGRIVPFDDIDATASALREVIGDRTRFGAAARARCQADFDAGSVVRRWETIIDEFSHRPTRQPE